MADSTTAIEAIGCELSVFVHPDNSRIILMSLVNAGSGNPGGCAGWVSQNGGQHWHGDNEPAFSPGEWDPAVVIRRVGSSVRYHILSITNAESDPGYPDSTWLVSGQRVAYKTSRTSTTWPNQTIVEDNINKTQHTDKGHLWVDNAPNGGNLYAAYSTFADGKYGLYVERSENNGESWINKVPLDTLASGEWGVNLKVAIDPTNLHHVYVVYPTGASGFQGAPSSIQFKKSTNAGDSWSSPTQVVSYGGAFGLREDLPGPNGMGTNSAPVMVVDEQANIYVVWGQKRRTAHDGTGTDAQIYVVKSADAGGTWTALGTNPKTVNQVGTGDQWLPWAAWDNGMKALVVSYFDSRNDADSAEVYLSVSYDRGATFREVKVSDVPWSGDLPTGGTFGAAGDYNGIDAGDGVAYPMWADNRESASVMKSYVSPIQLWGIVQDSISVSHSTDVGLVLNVTIDWLSDLWSDGLDQAIITAPSSAIYTASATPSGPTTSHSVSRTCVCEPGFWTLEVKSSRVGYYPMQKSDATKTFKVLWCLD